MWIVGFLLLALCPLWMSGCRKSGDSSVSPDWRKTIDASTEVFEEITTQPNAVPDGVLNLTKCVVMFPATSQRTRSTTGVAACREAHDRWLAPALVTFSAALNRGTPNAEGDLLIFVIGDAGVRGIRAGELAVSARTAGPGPTIGEAITITDADIKRDLLVYRRAGKTIEGADAAGVIRGAAQPSRSAISTTPLLEAVTAYFNSITPIGIIVHHSSTLTAAQPLPRGVGDVDQFHAQRGFDILCEGQRYHVAYHYLILPDGRIQAGRPERCEGAHSSGYNSYLGISMVGDFSSHENPRGQRGNTRPTKQQMAALVSLSRRLMARYHIPVNRVLRHSDVARTECPGDRFPFRLYLSELQ